MEFTGIYSYYNSDEDCMIEQFTIQNIASLEDFINLPDLYEYDGHIFEKSHWSGHRRLLYS